MKFPERLVILGVAAVLTVGVAASGCATPWFGGKAAPDAGSAQGQSDMRQAAVTYINGLCKLPKEQRDPVVRELNEALLPNHAAISCGRAGESYAPAG
jgi:hypothetical protein